MDLVVPHVRRSAPFALLALGWFAWNARCTSSDRDRWVRVDGVEVLVPAGTVLRTLGRQPDWDSSVWSKKQGPAAEITDRDLPGAFVSVERSFVPPGRRKGWSDAWAVSAARVRRLFPATGRLGPDQAYESNGLKGWSGWWPTEAGATLWLARLHADGRAHLVIARLPPEDGDPRRSAARARLVQAAEGVRRR